ncbi:hypothetical protein LCGC14_2114780 [marine sediment metagenome]|uniref:Uncharacterized protein n=1 Tax=marine sediment metagenome TaxID=412755 RepID=A0A0F9E642_9ZZZZ
MSIKQLISQVEMEKIITKVRKGQGGDLGIIGACFLATEKGGENLRKLGIRKDSSLCDPGLDDKAKAQYLAFELIKYGCSPKYVDQLYEMHNDYGTIRLQIELRQRQRAHDGAWWVRAIERETKRKQEIRSRNKARVLKTHQFIRANVDFLTSSEIRRLTIECLQDQEDET